MSNQISRTTYTESFKDNVNRSLSLNLYTERITGWINTLKGVFRFEVNALFWIACSKDLSRAIQYVRPIVVFNICVTHPYHNLP
jgi:hypothetical protein